MKIRTEIPVKIDDSHIEEAIIEVRFEHIDDEDLVFASFFSQFKDEFPNREKPGYAQLPFDIRSNDPNLKYKPVYRLETEGGDLVLLSSRIFGLVKRRPYSGWKDFVGQYMRYLNQLRTTYPGIKSERVGVRYINKFDGWMRPNLDITVEQFGTRVEPMGLELKMLISDEGFSSRILYVESPGEGKRFSVIDIDTFKEGKQLEIDSAIEEAHAAEKRAFFSIISESYIKSLNPEY